MSTTIFISIASYRDPQTVPTIQDAINQADRPEELTFGVVLQQEPDEIDLSKIHTKKSNIKQIEINWRESRGACWTRNLIQRLLLKEEKYYLQLDSHHRFIKGWDSVLINMIENLKKQYEKPIIGTYAPKYIPETEFRDLIPTRLSSLSDFKDDGDLMFMPKAITNFSNLQVPARFLSGHFLFTDKIFCEECIYDPNIYFRGEELSLSARAYTKGYDMFHPTDNIIWHEYTRQNQIKHWNDHTKNNGFIISADDLSRKGKTRVRHLLQMEKNKTNFGKYGLGNQRSLHEYELFAGFNLKTRQIHKYAYNINNDYPDPFIMSEEEWEQGLMKKMHYEFVMPKDLVNTCYRSKNLEYLSIVFQNDSNKTVFRKDINKSDLEKIINSNNYAVKIITSMDGEPNKALLLPKIIDGKFLTKITLDKIKKISL